MRSLYFAFLLVVLSKHVLSQPAKSSLQSALTDYYKQINPEFINIHTDRSVYLPGETIYYRLNLVNDPYVSQKLSSIVYVELQDQTATVLMRQKLRAHLGKVVGSLSLPCSLSPGKYVFSAFSLWMKHSGVESAEMRFHILNVTAPNMPTNYHKQLQNANVKILKNSLDTLEFSIQHDRPGRVTLHQKGTIYFEQEFIPKEKDRYILKDPPFGDLLITMWDRSSMPIWEHTIITKGEKQYLIKASFDKESYKTRDRISLEIEVFDPLSRPLEASVSVSVTPQAHQRTITNDATIPFSLVLENLSTIPREMIIYPRNPKTIDPLNFLGEGQPCHEIALESIKLPVVINTINDLWRKKIYANYGNPVKEIVWANYSLPYDDEYIVSEYPTLTTIKDLLKEIPPNVRVKERKTTSELWITNYEQRGKVFRYHGKPLLLIDGAIFPDLSRFLTLNLQELEKIDVIWRRNTINSSALGPLAANGIISVYSKNESFLKALNGDASNFIPIFSTYSKPKMPDYSFVEHWSEKSPDMRNPIYWNPDVDLHRKTKITFYTSDETGEYKILVKGISKNGILIDDQLSVLVTN